MTDTIILPRSVVEQAISTIVELEYSSSTAVSDKMARDSKAALRAALEQPQVEQPPRQPLTDEEIRDVAFDVDAAYGSVLEFARAIERAHGIGGEA